MVVNGIWFGVMTPPADVKEHTYSAAIETVLVCKYWIVDLNVYLVKQFFGNKQNITFVSMTDDVYNTHA